MLGLLFCSCHSVALLVTPGIDHVDQIKKVENSTYLYKIISAFYHAKLACT